MKYAAAALMLLSALTVSAQMKTMGWDSEMCRYMGTFDSKKYTAQQLRNTQGLTVPGTYGITSEATAFSPADIDKLSVARLTKEYLNKRAQLNALDIVRTPYWESLRQKKLAEIKQVYELSLVSIKAYRTPTSLNELGWADTCKTRFARPLIAGGDDLLRAWLAVNLDSRSKNSDPERLRRIFDQQNASPDRFAYARVEVMTFGWWNCANEFINYVDYDGTAEREFKKLFVRVREQCDEP